VRFVARPLRSVARTPRPVARPPRPSSGALERAATTAGGPLGRVTRVTGGLLGRAGELAGGSLSRVPMGLCGAVDGHANPVRRCATLPLRGAEPGAGSVNRARSLGSVSDLIGPVLRPLGPAVAPAGSVFAPAGSALAPVGSALAPVGSVLAPVGSVLAPVGSMLAPVVGPVGGLVPPVVPGVLPLPGLAGSGNGASAGAGVSASAGAGTFGPAGAFAGSGGAPADLLSSSQTNPARPAADGASTPAARSIRSWPALTGAVSLPGSPASAELPARGPDPLSSSSGAGLGLAALTAALVLFGPNRPRTRPAGPLGHHLALLPPGRLSRLATSGDVLHVLEVADEGEVQVNLWMKRAIGVAALGGSLLALGAGTASAQEVSADISARVGRSTSAEVRVCADGRVLSRLVGSCSGQASSRRTSVTVQAGRGGGSSASGGIRVRTRVPRLASADVSVGTRRSRPSATAPGQTSVTTRPARTDATAAADTSPRAGRGGRRRRLPVDPRDHLRQRHRRLGRRLGQLRRRPGPGRRRRLGRVGRQWLHRRRVDRDRDRVG
jgi:hypothetical protein